MLKNTWESHGDHAPIAEALRNVSITAQAIEDAQERFDNMNKIIAIQQDIKLTRRTKGLALLQPGRKYVMEDMFVVQQTLESEGRKRKVILFNDLLLVAKPIQEKKREMMRLDFSLRLCDITTVLIVTNSTW